MADSESKKTSANPPYDPPTVIDQDLYGKTAPSDHLKSADSGTRTVLHQAAEDGERPSADLENQKTVISPRSRQAPILPGSASPTELGRLLQGQQLGHFVLDEFVGGGGMGAVFRGTDLQLGRTVAVKVLSRDQGADPETLRRFKNEAQSAARLDHENIARVFFVGEHEGWNFIVFEFIEGVNLRDMIERGGPLPMEQAIEYTVQVAEALEHAAQRDVVHRDIKPSNVLVTKDGRAKLVDMGLARLHQLEAGHSDLTASGVTLGTFDYISPEQASDPRRADVRSDLYSLGCTMYFMLVGRPPFPHGTVLQKLLAHSGETPPDPRDERPELPPELSKIILRLLAKRPDQRYAQPREFISDMLVLRDRLGLDVMRSAEGRAPAGERLTWRDRLLTVGTPLAVVLLTIVGLDFYWSQTASNAQHTPGFRLPENDAADIAVPAVGDESATRAGTRAEEDADASESPDGAAEAPAAVPPRETSGAANGGSDEVADGESPNNVSGESVSRPSEPDAAGDPDTAANRNAADDGAAEEGAAEGMRGAGSPRDAADPGDEDVAIGSASDTATARDEPEDAALGNSSGLDDASAPPKSAVSLSDEPTADPAVRRIVIGNAADLGDLGASVRIFPTLGEALASSDFQDHIETIDEIEVRSSNLLVPAPLAIDLPAGKHLTIRGVPSDNVPPEINVVAKPSGQPARDRGLIEPQGGKLTLENLHLHMRVDKGLDRSHDIALFRLPAALIGHVELSACVLTVENPPSDVAPSAAFFDVIPDDAEEIPGPIPIHLKACVLRGEATVIRMRQSTPVDFVWNNGLLATSERLLLAQGTKQEVGDATIRLSLLNLTADIGRGLCLLRDTKERPNQPDLELICNKSILSANGSPLVEHDGIGPYERYQRGLFIRGDWNVYEDVDKFWEVSVDNVVKAGLDWPGWDEKLEMGGSMPSSVESVRWDRLRSDLYSVPMHERSVEDYRLDPEATRTAAVRNKAGLRAEELPLPEPKLPAEERDVDANEDSATGKMNAPDDAA